MTTGSTLLGIKCPKCGSFVKEGLSRCPVCGYELKEEEKKPISPPQVSRSFPSASLEGGLKCPECGYVNPPNARFCKNCGYRFQAVEQRKAEKKKAAKKQIPSSVRISLNWVYRPQNINLPSHIPLEPLRPHFEGIGEWEGFGFAIYKKGFYQELLLRKVDPATQAKLYAKLSRGIVVQSGTEFYLGAVGFQLLGSLHPESAEQFPPEGTQPMTQQAAPGGGKTVIVGPGEELGKIYSSGASRIRILNLDVANDSIPIRKRTLFGRNFLSENLKLDPTLLAENGVSGEHVEVLPLEGGSWLINPVKGKFFYIEIGETPLILEEGSVIRWVGRMSPPGEAIIELKI